MSVRPDLPLSKFARAQALERLEDVARQMRLVRRDPSADAVHDLRVSIRRFSSVLQVFPTCFSRKRAARGRKRLKTILKAAGEVRDRDIALGLAARSGNGDVNGLVESLERERHAAARRLRRLVRKDRRRKVLATAKQSVRRKKPRRSKPPAKTWNPAAPASENAVNHLPELFRNLFEAGRQALVEPVDLAELHALRLKTKRRRYTLELFEPCYGPEIGERLEQLKNLQDLLGDINDCRASKDLAQDDEMHAYLDEQRDQRIARFERFWNEELDAPGECEGWMLELARRSAQPKPPPQALSSVCNQTREVDVV